MIKNIKIKIYSKNKNSKISEFIKNTFLQSNNIVEIIHDFDIFIEEDSITDCLFINYSNSSDTLDEKRINKLKDMFFSHKISNIYFVSDSMVNLPSFIDNIPTKDLTKETLQDILNELQTKLYSNNIETITRSRAIIINNLCNDGFSTRHNGTIMLVDAIILAILNKKLVVNLRKDIYPFLMQKYGISNSCVELSINKAINHAYSHYSSHQFNGTPTNKELLTYKICELYDYISDAL